MNRRTPIRPHASQRPAQDQSYPAYPRSQQEPAGSSILSPEQISVIDPSDLALPSDEETAEALGMQEAELSEEIRDEERQRHPEVLLDDQDPRD